MRNLMLSCVLFVAVSLSLPAISQTSGVGETSPAQPPTSSVNSEQPLQRDKTFTGKITKHGKDYVLYDMATNLTLRLDNQSLASKYLGKEVSVLGQFVAAGNMIHVTKVEPAQ
jgi:hypothetical protein